ncbi:PLP-dependent aminotransferase family protein [Ferruginivarius sediminum]|uniref:PLP-dependent aminotransferase family protein n=1 Tax=Ferruginivarius sediminum TaxID=2661937 RepID=A0A369TBW9_9PROT|nr:PLP-dependent aminotransferase family protein [Ferruginivarius sediminum]RDD62342.1 PLP-dependent aminotransferase family protein [Ferruginivarius sediminum]
MWVPDISKIDGPRYLALASAIAEAIDSGELGAGAQLPPQRDLAEQLNVTVGTVGRAYNIVKKRQLVTGEVGRGTFVRDIADNDERPNFLPERMPGTIDFACYRSPVEGLSEALSSALAEVAERAVLLPIHKYPPAAGFLSHRTAGATWIRRTGLDVPPERIIVCGGAQQAIQLSLAALATPGETILTETLTYSGVKSLGALLNLPLAGVAIDEQGIVPERLEAAIAETGGRILYLQPTVHNPTAAVMPEERRRRIADIARRHELILIEDDAGVSALTDRPLPIAHFAPERTIYITSLSKSISPAFRVAFIATPARLVERMSNTLHGLTLAASPLTMEVASVMISSGTADEIARNNLAELKKRHTAALRGLKGWDAASHPAAFFIWVNLPEHWTAAGFDEATRREGLSLVPADNFTVGDAVPARGVRISINPGQKEGMLESGIETLTRMMRDRPQPRPPVV